uniref:Predicted protein n=1 Tax=Hordeum vulgare subsp. vulgare TaxID=112509 RepID=F2EKL7_HORVV|nr:predicted protein [Hordeum vulgare subsp. vulgare]
MSNIFGKKGKSFSGPDSPHRGAARVRFKSASLNCVDSPKKQNDDTCKYRVFVGTWNVGGKNPNDGLNLQDFLQVDESSDIYVLGFQEIVPLTAGNVLVLEDNEPAARWLALIHQALNHPQEQPDSDEPPPQPSEPGPADAARQQQNRRRDAMATRSSSGNLFFQTPSLKVLSNSYRVDSALVKTCNCSPEASLQRRRATEVRESVYRAAETPPASTAAEATSTAAGGWDDDGAAGTPGQCEPPSAADGGGMSYCLIASKQMVGLFLSVWVKKELVEHVGHLRVDCVGRGIMRWLGNKGCIAMSMTLHHTSLCFVCSHLASGEKEGDEVRRNADVAEILKSAHFPRACKSPSAQRVLPERILEHEYQDDLAWGPELPGLPELRGDEDVAGGERLGRSAGERPADDREGSGEGVRGLEGGKDQLRADVQVHAELRRVRRRDGQVQEEAANAGMVRPDTVARRRHRAAAVPAGRVQVLRPPAGLGRVRRRGGGRRRQDEELLLHVRADRPRQARVAAEARQLRRALVVAAAL